MAPPLSRQNDCTSSSTYGTNSSTVTKPTGSAAATAVRTFGRARTRSSQVGRAMAGVGTRGVSIADTASLLDGPGEGDRSARGGDRARRDVGDEAAAPR